MPPKPEKVESKLLGLKNPVQLTGYLASVVVGFLGAVSARTDYILLVIAGLIAVSIFFFGIALNGMEHYPKKERPKLVIRIYVIFGIIITTFLILATVIYSMGGKRMRAAMSTDLRGEIARQIGIVQNAVEQLEAKKKAAEATLNTAIQLAAEPAVERMIAESKSLGAQIQAQTKLLLKLQGLHDELALPDSELSRIFREILAKNPNDSSVALAADQIASKADLGGLEGFFEAQLQANVRDIVHTRVNLAWLKYMGGDFKSARALFLKVLQDNHTNQEALEGLAEMETEDGDYIEAARYLDELISVYRSSPPRTSGKLAFALAHRATNARFQNDWQSASNFVEQCESLLTANSANRDFYATLAANDLGFFYFLTGRFRRANELFDQSLGYYKAAPKSYYGYTEILNNYGVFCRYSGDFDRSETLLREAKKLLEGPARGSYGYAITLQNLGVTLLFKADVQSSQNALEESRRVFNRMETSPIGRAMSDFELSILKLSTSQGSNPMHELKTAADRIVTACSNTHYRSVETRRRMSEALRAFFLVEDCVKVLRESPDEALTQVPGFIAAAYEAEVLLVNSIKGSSPKTFPERCGNLEKRLTEFNEPFPWIDRKLRIAKAFHALHLGERSHALAIFNEILNEQTGISYLEQCFLKGSKARYFSP